MNTTEFSINNTNIQFFNSSEDNKRTLCSTDLPLFCGVSCGIVESMFCGIPLEVAIIHSLFGVCSSAICLDCVLGDRQIKIFSIDEQPIIRQPESKQRKEHLS